MGELEAREEKNTVVGESRIGESTETGGEVTKDIRILFCHPCASGCAVSVPVCSATLETVGPAVTR